MIINMIVVTFFFFGIGMNVKQKNGYLGVILALSAAIYLPQANASILSVPSPTEGDSFNIFNLTAGNFTDYYSFNVASDALFSFTGNSVDTLGTGGLSFLTNGASLTNVYLLDITSNKSTAAHLTSNTVTKVSPINASDTYTQTSYSASLGGILLNSTDSYELVFTGHSENSNSTVGGTLFLEPTYPLTSPGTVNAVPLSSSTWMFLTGIVGFLGLSRNSNANKAV
ncbi:hypothetical protein [Methylomonas sp. AM2-LC]|uniref:hypothetical protein n=1 Tax=Methylomonas sp. AM2-LC TaxID=3153301 RepID=UPI0032648080